MQQSQLKAAVTLIKVTSTSPQEDAVNSGKGGHSSRENRRSKEKKKKTKIEETSCLELMVGPSLPKAVQNWGWGETLGPKEGVGVTRWVLSLAKGDMCVLSRSVVSDSS